MKRIFIILDSGTAIRNILRTDVFRRLQQEDDLELVVFSPVRPTCSEISIVLQKDEMLEKWTKSIQELTGFKYIPEV